MTRKKSLSSVRLRQEQNENTPIPHTDPNDPYSLKAETWIACPCVECPKCDGEGWSLTADGQDDCPTCNGRRYVLPPVTEEDVEAVAAVVRSGVYDHAPFDRTARAAIDTYRARLGSPRTGG